jgi:hypothetical protein
MKERTRVSGLATAYILCNGKDKHIVAKWSLFPIKNCSKGTYILLISCPFKLRTAAPYQLALCVCLQIDVNCRCWCVSVSNGKGILIAVGVLIVMGLICFWNFRRRFKAAGQQLAQVRTTGRSLRLSAGDLLALHHQESPRREGFHHLEGTVPDHIHCDI